MSTFERCLAEARNLSPEEQTKLVAELSRGVLLRRLREVAGGPNAPLPLSDDEINRLAHEARREALRARGL